ncbi:MAG: 2-oxoacid:ferredoxin oxidoreductase subunit beta [Chloroflexota bacterium]
MSQVAQVESYLRSERLPHIWCPGCGIGTALNVFLNALAESGLDPNQVTIVSGIGCSGRAAGYMKLDSFHTTHGRAIPFATGLKLANPALKVVVFSGDGDLVAIGGNHLIHAARRNIDLTVICVNNFNYGMTGGQKGPTTPLGARTQTSPLGNAEEPFNLPYLAASCGASYVARWTVAHVLHLKQGIKEALLKKGFSLVEVISPCPTLYGRMNRQPTALEQMRYYRQNGVIQDGADPKDAGISLDGKIILGKFIDRERPTYSELQEESLKRAEK